MTTNDKITAAKAYVAKLPHAVSGDGGHPATYRTASILAHGFALDFSDAWQILQDWNLTHCSPPWSEKELRHKLNDAYVKAHDKPRGWIIKGRERQVGSNGRFVLDTSKIAELVDAQTPFKTVDVLLNCFDHGDIICITNDAGQTEDGRYFPASKGFFLTREEWINKFFSDGAPGAEKFNTPLESGAWIRINPFQPDKFDGTDSSVSKYRHVLIEFDRKPKAEQLAIFQQSNLPISLLVDSGGKSIHAWVRVDAESKEQWEQRRNKVYEYLSDHEPDPQNKNPSRWSRLGGVFRGDKEQTIIGFRIGSESWEAFETWVESQDFPDEINPTRLGEYDVQNDPNKVVGLGRYLTKGGSLIVIGQSGIGKSSFVMQMACSWAIGRELFGIPVIKPLKIGVIQAECDIGDLAQSYQGVTSGMDLKPEEISLLNQNLKFFKESAKTGRDFVDLMRKIITRLKLDMIVVDPLLSYVGGDVSKQDVSSNFLRNMVQPVLDETGCIIVLIHHEGKPKTKDALSGETISDMAYSGLGSSDITNWVRAVINIRRESKDKPIFSFNLSKRGKEAGLRMPDGRSTLSIKLKHADDKVQWEVSHPLQAFELLRVGQQYAHFGTKPETTRKALIEELIKDYSLSRDQAEAVIKALITNAVMVPRRKGAIITYVGSKA